MVWAKLDDEILDNPKIASAGVLGFALHVAAITWCCRNLTDGFVPTARVRSMLDFGGILWDPKNPGGVAGGADSGGGNWGGDAVEIAEHLVEVGLWKPDPDGRGYWLNDFLDYNPSREKVLAERERARKGRGSGPPDKASPKRAPNVFGSSAERRPNVDTNSDGPVPVPVPVPVPIEPPIGGSHARATRSEIPKDEPLTDRRRGRAEARAAPKGVHLDVDAEWGKFVATSRANGKLVASVDDAWESWLIDAVKYAERDRHRESDRKAAHDKRYADHTPKYEQPTKDQSKWIAEELARRVAADAKKGAA